MNSPHTQNFPWVQTPKVHPCLPRLAQGKMKSRSFLESQSCAMRLFELVHSDLKSLLVESYHQFKYFIVFIDDKSSHMWMSNLRKKSDASRASRTSRQWHKSSMVPPSKDGESIKGGVYHSNLMDTLKGLGIVIEQSIPHQHQQNGQAKRAIRTIMEKAQCLCFTACLPQSWWEFCVTMQFTSSTELILHASHGWCPWSH